MRNVLMSGRRRLRAGAIGVAFAVVMALFGVTAPPAAAAGCSPSADFELDSYGYVQVSHYANCSYAKWYAWVRITSWLKRDGVNQGTPRQITYKGPTTGGWFAGYGSSARNYSGTQLFCAYTRIEWIYTEPNGTEFSSSGASCAYY